MTRYYLKQQAIKECLESRKKAVARKTLVGACLYTSDKVISGWNLENRIHKGYHAEEVAILNARIQEIEPKEIEGIVVSFSRTDISKHTFMCGDCRQRLWEFTFNSDLLVTEVDLDGKIIAEKTLGELYPNPFPLEEFKLKQEDVSCDCKKKVFKGVS
jgi:cytidine deaminase